jgi:hypothetical protein
VIEAFMNFLTILVVVAVVTLLLNLAMAALGYPVLWIFWAVEYVTEWHDEDNEEMTTTELRDRLGPTTLSEAKFNSEGRWR